MIALVLTSLALTLLVLTHFTTEAAISDRVYENCVLLGVNRLQLSWTVRMQDGAVDFELCGCGGVDSGDTSRTFVAEYMGFGLSRNPSRTEMVGSDAVIAYVDNNQGAFAIDYHLSQQTQCTREGGVGACPDTWDSRGGTCRDDVFNVSGFRRDRFQCVAYSRLMDTGDTMCDLPINVSRTDQYIVWAVGGFDMTAFRHFEQSSTKEMPLHLGRSPSNQCNTGVRCTNCPGFQEKVFDVTDRDAVFVANIGPPGGERGYQAITGQAGWGIAWYLNGSLIPHLHVQRGRTYTFIAESGNDNSSFDYHPFYLTDSRNGGRDTKSQERRDAETIYAGYDENGNPYGVGPYCFFDEPARANGILNSCGSEADYFGSLVRSCPNGMNSEPGRFSWTPDKNTPNELYYQCATHRNLGYKISVFPKIEDSSSGFIVQASLTATFIIGLATALL